MKNTIKKVVSLVLATALIFGVLAVAKPETVSARGNALSASCEVYEVTAKKLAWWQVWNWCKIKISNDNSYEMNTVKFEIFDDYGNLYKKGSVSGKSSTTVTLKSGHTYTVRLDNFNVFSGYNSPVNVTNKANCNVTHLK